MNRIYLVLSSRKVFLLPFTLALFLPLFFHGPRIGMPYVKGGDEIHYMAIINSLLIDGDLDLRNNYDAAREGSWQIGKKYAGQAIDPHVVWNVGGHQVIWSQVYEDTNKWTKDSNGFFVPLRKPNVNLDVSKLPEYSSHPAGIAFLLAPFLWLAKGTPLVESLALGCSNAAIIFSAFLFRRILRRYTNNPLSINVGTLLAFLGTPIWAYGRTLFMEPFLIFFALSAYLLAVEKKSSFWIGVLLGLGALLKPNFLILLFPLVLFFWKERQVRKILWMIPGPFLSTLFILYLNLRMYGSPFTPPQPFVFGNPLNGVFGLLFSWNHGIFAFAPVAFLAFFAWKQFFRAHIHEATLFASGFVIYFLMMAVFNCWWGGWCYGPRLVAPVLPFLMIPIFYLPNQISSWGKPIRILAFILCLLSVGFNLLGALDGYWDSHPLTILMGNIS